MRDPDLMLELLREMSQEATGQTQTYFMAINPTKDSQKRCHHFDLLVDAGHAEWVSNEKTIARITNSGYDFLIAIQQNEDLKTVFIDRFKRGMPYVKNALDIVAKAAELF